MSLEGPEESFLEEDIPGTSDIKKNLLNELETPMKLATDTSTECQVGQEHMKVYLRIRPLNDEEKKLGEEQVCY